MDCNLFQTDEMDDLKKFLTAVELCNVRKFTSCNGCPFHSKGYGECGKKKRDLARKFLQEIEQEEKATVHEPKVIMFGDNKTKAVISEWLDAGKNMLIGYKPTEGYRQWLVGHIVTISIEKAELAILGISTRIVTRFPLDRSTRLIKWTDGPTAELICTEAVGGYLLGERYYMRNGNMSPCIDTRSIPAKDGRFASLEDEFIEKHFVPYEGDVLDNKKEKYLNGWLVCTFTEKHLSVTAGCRYRIDGGCFVDDNGIHHNHYTNSVKDMEALKNNWHMIYVPDKN